MVKYGRIEQPKQPLPPAPNPYDLITIRVAGKETSARPVEFDSEPASNDIYNASGVPIKATKYVTSCPHCGAYLEAIPPNLDIACSGCGAGVKAAVVELPDPFCNPLTEKFMRDVDFDPDAIGVDAIAAALGPKDSPLDLGEELPE